MKKETGRIYIDKAKAEIEILLSYLPQQLNEEEISEIVRKAVDEVGTNSMKDIGKVMTLVMPKFQAGQMVNL